MRWFVFLILQGICAFGVEKYPPPPSNNELCEVMRRLYEACRTRQLQTGGFPQKTADLEYLLSPALRKQLPSGIEFADLASQDYQNKLRSPFKNRTPCLRLNLGEGRWLNVAYSGAIYESPRYWESEFVHLLPLPFASPEALRKDFHAIPERAAKRPERCTPAQIDLVPSCNALPTAPWFFGPSEDGPPLGDLPNQGVFEDHGTLFDVRGVLQVEGLVIQPKEGEPNFRSYPEQITNIRVGQSGQRVHLLAGTIFSAEKGTPVGTLTFHGKSGKSAEMPLRYGEHVASGADEATAATRIFPKPGQAAGMYSLYAISFTNPLGDEVIESLDFRSDKSASHPFVLAMTMEP